MICIILQKEFNMCTRVTFKYETNPKPCYATI